MIMTEKTRATGNVCEYVMEKERGGKCTDEGKRKRGSSHTFSSKASTLKFVSPAQVGKRRRRKWLNEPLFGPLDVGSRVKNLCGSRYLDLAIGRWQPQRALERTKRAAWDVP